ncbi:MAG: hypothetical protein ACYC63_08930 [Armatimonadota bacterium]
MRVFTISRAITASAARGFAAPGSRLSAFGTALTTSNTIIWYLATVAFIAVVVWVALGLLRQRPAAARAVHVLLPVLLTLTALSVLRTLPSAWLHYLPLPGRPEQEHLWIRYATTGLEVAALLWAAMAYRHLSDTPAVSDEWRERAAWALSVPSLISWAWIIFSAQAVWNPVTSLAPIVGTSLMAPNVVAHTGLHALPFGLIAFFMVRDGLQALERDREAFSRLSRSILAVLIVSGAVGVYAAYVWVAEGKAFAGEAGSIPRYAAALFVVAIAQWLVLSGVSLLAVRKWRGMAKPA